MAQQREASERSPGSPSNKAQHSRGSIFPSNLHCARAQKHRWKAETVNNNNTENPKKS